MVELLLGGWDLTSQRTYLASVDYLGNMTDTTPFVFRGIAGKFCYSILDRLYTPTMTEQQAADVVRMCVDEVRVYHTITGHLYITLQFSGTSSLRCTPAAIQFVGDRQKRHSQD
jgi:20S proteasome alpha/beta subunit